MLRTTRSDLNVNRIGLYICHCFIFTVAPSVADAYPYGANSTLRSMRKCPHKHTQLIYSVARRELIPRAQRSKNAANSRADAQTGYSFSFHV
eukprot:5221324-Pleurochrysis_carterae.AAC.1